MAGKGNVKFHVILYLCIVKFKLLTQLEQPYVVATYFSSTWSSLQNEIPAQVVVKALTGRRKQLFLYLDALYTRYR